MKNEDIVKRSREISVGYDDRDRLGMIGQAVYISTAQETRKKIANEVEQWILEHTYDPKYWDDYGENFCHSIFATDLKNFIRERSKL